MAHESRLTRELRNLLNTQRAAALGTLGDDGAPLVSMVPFAIAPELARLVIHVSGLAAHTRNLLDRPAVSLLVMRAEVAGQPVHALPRVSLTGRAEPLVADSPDWRACRGAYLGRFPEAEAMTLLDDFAFMAIEVTAARQVAGFGAARSIDARDMAQVLAGRRGPADDPQSS